MTLSFNYDGYNRLASETQGSPTGGGFAHFQYDARGNQTQSTVVFTSTPHTFDAKNQMLQIPGVATYSYDEAGRRIKKVLANGQTSYFFYSQAGQLMYEYNATAAQPTDYLYLNGKLIARFMSSQNPTDLLTDRQGTPVREVDYTGAVAQSFSYRPFGQLYSGPSQQQPGYTGHVQDPESSLNYMQQRYQDGGLGQFLSVDPMAPVPGDVLNFNRYAYAGNNPVSNIDQDGRESACVTMKPGCGGGNPAAKAAGTAVANVLLGFAKSVANAASDAVGLIASQEGQPLQASNSQQAVGMMVGGVIVNAAEAVATDGEKVSTLEPGPYAKESIPGHMGRPTASEQRQVNALMEKNGCHSCGTKNPGTMSGNAIVDHQPPQAPGETTDFYPHCIDCMRRQGGEVLQQKIRDQQ